MQRNKKLRICIVLLLFFLISFNYFEAKGFHSLAEESRSLENNEVAVTYLPYLNYLNLHKTAPSPLLSINIAAEDFIDKSANVKKLNEYNEKSDVIEFSGGEGFSIYEVKIDQAGLYNIEATFIPLENMKLSKIIVGIRIDDKISFGAMDGISLNRPWHDVTDFVTDKNGNQIQADQTESYHWTTEAFNDPERRYNEPLKFYFEEGTHTIKLLSQEGEFVLSDLSIYNDKALPSYEDVEKTYQEANYIETKNIMKFIEAEKYSEKSDSRILPEFDKSDAATQPNDPAKLILNYIPGYKCRDPGQWIEWDVDVPQSGLYKIDLRVRQNLKSGFTSNRKLLIDGEVPFEECNIIKFGSSNRWYIKSIGTNNDPYLFYLKEGNHKIRLEVIPGAFSNMTLTLDACIYRLNSLYRKVIMVAGTMPDKYRDYNLTSEIPELSNELKDLKNILEVQERDIINENEKSGSELSTIRTLINLLDVFILNPDKLAKMIGSFKGNIEALSSWNKNAKRQPLDLDYILLSSPDEKTPQANATFFQGFLFEIQRLLASYMKGFGEIGDSYEGQKSVKVWLNGGRDQLKVLRELVDNEYNRKSTTKINIQLVPIGIREAVLAGKQPDIALFALSDEPVNLALRNSLVDLTQFKTFNEVKARFMEGTTVPMEIGDKCYGLPLTEDVSMMFVRTDIFNELGLKVPDTWDEMYALAAELQRKNMNIGIPANLGMFATLLFQNNGEFYNSEKSATMFASEPAMNAFETWTGFFSQFGFPLQFEFYNRFRSGEMPIGIASITMYPSFQILAPEINNQWEMFQIPGTRQADNSINRSLSIATANGTSTSPGLTQNIFCAMMFEKTKEKEAAWEFLDWFTTTDIQTKYGYGIEAMLGPLARYATANVEAFKNLPWTESAKTDILEQWKNIKTIPEISGNYYIARDINNAFRRVVYFYENPTDMLNRYNVQINKELNRKRIEVELRKKK